MHHTTRRIARGVAGPLVAAAALTGAGLATAATASAAPAHHPAHHPTHHPTHTHGAAQAVGHVYVDDNTATHNTIAGYERHADGRLTPLPGSPFPAGGAGTGAGLASQGAIQLASDHRFVLAVDAGSNEISVLRVQRDGGLSPVGHPVSSGGTNPVSVTEHDGLVYVANAGPATTNYTGFELSRDGRLAPLAHSTVTLPSAAQPGDVLFNPTGTRLIGTRVGTSQIDSFLVRSDGRLTVGAGSPSAAQGTGPFGSTFSPTSPNELFVTNAHNAPGDSTVSTFEDLAGGTLAPVGSAPVANGQSGTCWAAITPDGRTLVTVNTGSGTITSYSVGGTGAPRVVATIPIPNGSGAGNSVDAGVSRDGRFVYTTESVAGAIDAFAVRNGHLVAAGSVALPAMGSAAGIAVQ